MWTSFVLAIGAAKYLRSRALMLCHLTCMYGCFYKGSEYKVMLTDEQLPDTQQARYRQAYNGTGLLCSSQCVRKNYRYELHCRSQPRLLGAVQRSFTRRSRCLVRKGSLNGLAHFLPRLTLSTSADINFSISAVRLCSSKTQHQHVFTVSA